MQVSDDLQVNMESILSHFEDSENPTADMVQLLVRVRLEILLEQTDQDRDIKDFLPPRFRSSDSFTWRINDPAAPT